MTSVGIIGFGRFGKILANILQKGFTIKDRLLRPSLVGVSKKVTKKEEKTEQNQENSGDK